MLYNGLILGRYISPYAIKLCCRSGNLQNYTRVLEVYPSVSRTVACVSIPLPSIRAGHCAFVQKKNLCSYACVSTNVTPHQRDTYLGIRKVHQHTYSACQNIQALLEIVISLIGSIQTEDYLHEARRLHTQMTCR